MSNAMGHSYLEMSVLPELRRTVVSAQPVIVFSESLKDILWANAAGARLFGGKGVVDLLAMEIPESNPVMRQLRNSVDQMGDKKKMVRGFRLTQGGQTQLLQFEIHRFNPVDDEIAYRVTHLDEYTYHSVSEAMRAQSAVDALEDFATAAAIVDDNGLLIAKTADYADIAPTSEQITKLANELQEENDRLIKQLITLDSGVSIAIGLARLTDNPNRNLIVIAENAEEESEVSPELSAASVVTAGAVAGYVDEAEANDEVESDQDDDPGIDSANVATDDSDDVTALDIADEPETEPETGSEETAVGEAPEPVEPTEPEPLSEQMEPESSAQEKDFQGQRFAWTIDAENRITSISDLLAECVGSENADIVGKDWGEISDALGIDADQEISRLLAKRDTWSSKIVSWPVGETGESLVPIELAALPVFNKDREFDGFRGYGKILENPSEIVASTQEVSVSDDAETTSSAFTSHSEVTSDDEHDAAEQTETLDAERIEVEDALSDEFGDEPEIQIEGAEDATVEDVASTSNIVPFSRPTSQPRELTPDEQQAFSSVRETLSEVQDEEEEEPQVDEEETETIADTGLLEKLPVAVLVYQNNQILYANRLFLDTSGFESLGKLKSEETASTILGALSSENEKGQTVLNKQDGTRISISPILHTVPWEGKKAVLLSFAPPAERNRKEGVELSRLSEIQNILDTTNDGILLMDEDGSIISVNGPAEALFGLEFNEAVDKPFETFFAPESRQAVTAYLGNVMESGLDRLINDGTEAIALEAGGGFIPVFVTITRMEASGKLCAVLRDITNWKKAEEELIQSRRKAEHSSEQKSEFLAQVSHEIRTPLNAIIGFSDVMIEERFGPVGNEKYKEYIQDIKKSGAHVLEIVNGLLDLSRIEAGKLDLSFEAVDLNELVAETVALLQPEANANRTIIRTSLSRSVPKVVADPRSIRQIVLNLVSNAIKYSQNNSQVVVSTVYESNGEVALRVRDTGKGMSEEQVKHAMEPFQQAHDITERSVQGSGLGLPLTKALVEANRAFFELESQPGHGTIAHVQFPVQRVLSE